MCDTYSGHVRVFPFSGLWIACQTSSVMGGASNEGLITNIIFTIIIVVIITCLLWGGAAMKDFHPHQTIAMHCWITTMHSHFTVIIITVIICNQADDDSESTIKFIYSGHALGRINGFGTYKVCWDQFTECHHHHLKAHHRHSHLKSRVNPWLALFSLNLDKKMNDAEDWLTIWKEFLWLLSSSWV